MNHSKTRARQAAGGRWRPLAAALLATSLLAGCATVSDPDPADPWESYNRSMTRFNESVDKAVIKPVATAYRDAVPKMARRGVSNFFGNLDDVRSFINNVLQGKAEGSFSSFWRVAINTTIGLGGLFDPASEMGLQRYREDFGQTLGYWGVGPGPYLVLPILGPSTLRDTAALPVDSVSHPLYYVQGNSVRVPLVLLRGLDIRTRLLGADDLVDSMALDSYTFMRDAWLQKRRNDVYDGNPPPDEDAEERYDLDADDGGPTRYDLDDTPRPEAADDAGERYDLDEDGNPYEVE